MRNKQVADFDFAQAMALGLAFSVAAWAIVAIGVIELF